MLNVSPQARARTYTRTRCRLSGHAVSFIDDVIALLSSCEALALLSLNRRVEHYS